MVFCPNCQHDSTDPLFCNRCHSLLSAPLGGLPQQVTLRDGRVVDCSGWQGVWPADCLTPLLGGSPDRPSRLYAFHRESGREIIEGAQHRAAVALEVLAPLEILPVANGTLVVAEALPGAVRPLATPASGDQLVRLEDAVAACEMLAAALQPLHRAGLVWLNFDPEALEIDGIAIRLTNLDLYCFPAGACPDRLRLSPTWSPPEVCGFRGERIGPATDVFHVSLYLYHRLAGLLPGGFPGKGLEAFDFAIPPLRIYNPHLPPGIAPVLERGLARDPDKRFPSIADLAGAFTGTVERAKHRHSARGPVAWDQGSATVIGRSHELQNLPNQDAHALLPSSGRLLAILADGVTHARFGSGEVASRTAVQVLARTLPAALQRARTDDQADHALDKACLDASEAILDLAQSTAPSEECDPVEMMSTTMLVGIVSGNVLTLASAGDSRAYLIADGQAEQLTVDGDVRCTHLAAGWAPEEVRDMGVEASALYTGLGVGEPSANGKLEVCLRRTLPRISRWRLLPGDVVVLCSDGLVEEGSFLEPAELPLLVAKPPGQSAAEIAQRLLQAARSRHRDASPEEPAGFGDDITCIVVRISRRESLSPT
jgi:serine/threonine protein phosphatase PrpC